MQESNSQLRIEDVKVTSVEKRKRHGSKNFEFVLSVRWSSGVENIIYRQYSMFFDLQEGLKLILQDKYQVAIPDLPVPKVPGRALFSSVAKKECRVVEEFCQRIIHLPSTVSASEIVLKFFSEWGTDAVNNQNQSPNNRTQQARQSKDKHEEHVLDHVTDNVVERYRAVARYMASSSGEMTLGEGEVVTVIEKNLTGWWLVANDRGQHGFAPATFLDPLDPTRACEAEEWVDYDGDTRLWRSIEAYTAQSEDEVSYGIGEEMEVIATSNCGWWKVRCHGKVGVTPASNLTPKQDEAETTEVEYATIRDRVASFTVTSPIYASIKRPPPRRDSSRKKDVVSRPPLSNDESVVAYATVEILQGPPSYSKSNENVPEYATVIPKHLRKKRTDALVEDKKEAESVLSVPPPLVNPQDSDGTTIQKSVWQRSRSQGDDGFVGSHGYLNVSHGLDVMLDLYETVTCYKAPADRPEDLSLAGGIIVRALSRDGPFYLVSTIEFPSRQGWVPDYVLKKKTKTSGHRRSRSVSDLHSHIVEITEDQRLPEAHARAPAPTTRKKCDAPRHHSFDVGMTEVPYEEMDAFSAKNEGTQTWFHGKMKRRDCEDVMLKHANELEFLVRESQQKFASFVLSVKYSGKIRHFPIELTPSKRFVIGKHAFGSLKEIVDFYRSNPLFYTQSKTPVFLGLPFKDS
ncbi:SH3 and PX domain-containing protein 2A [Nematostella vectensis]|uniref:SH3 and PX domain-containing protein 2A n=1 Tax=Nematostella vectensis TaxID=45351 RepID=UPI0020779BBF|nr:SH3 and PX domain-containing protein 2A [Nematostella vectensis]